MPITVQNGSSHRTHRSQKIYWYRTVDFLQQHTNQAQMHWCEGVFPVRSHQLIKFLRTRNIMMWEDDPSSHRFHREVFKTLIKISYSTFAKSSPENLFHYTPRYLIQKKPKTVKMVADMSYNTVCKFSTPHYLCLCASWGVLLRLAFHAGCCHRHVS